MRLNCPHCESLLSAEINFEKKKQAYVRCANCEGFAVIHRSAVLIEQKAKIPKDDFTLENIIVMPPAPQNRFSETAREVAAVAPASPPVVSSPVVVPPVMMMVTPPPFMVAMEKIEIPNDLDFSTPLPTPPVFTQAKPPAFLLRENPNAVQHFAEVERKEEAVNMASPLNKKRKASSSLAVWIAAAIAMVSGIYLYAEGKKALSSDVPQTTTSVSVPQ